MVVSTKTGNEVVSKQVTPLFKNCSSFQFDQPVTNVQPWSLSVFWTENTFRRLHFYSDYFNQRTGSGSWNRRTGELFTWELWFVLHQAVCPWTVALTFDPTTISGNANSTGVFWTVGAACFFRLALSCFDCRLFDALRSRSKSSPTALRLWDAGMSRRGS